jgi:DNA-binding GntR family transcriptional regulator
MARLETVAPDRHNGGLTLPSRTGRPTNQTMSERPLLQSTSLPDAILEELSRRILSGEYRAGQKLNEMDLAARFGVSRGPVREALRGLEKAGLVRMERNRGAFVREPSRTDADQLYDVRTGLDELAARLACQRATPAQAKGLRQFLARMETLAEQDDGISYHLVDIKFHERIVMLTGNTRLLELYRRISNEMHLMRSAALARREDMVASNTEHAALVEAMVRRDDTTATALMRKHVEAERKRFVARLLVQSEP